MKMKRSLLVSALLRKANLPAGLTVAEAKAEEDAAWRRRQAGIRHESFCRQTGRRVPLFES